MNRSTERRVVRRARGTQPRWGPALATGSTDGDVHILDTRADFGFRVAAPQLPPTRAARPPRSRGVFSREMEPPKKHGVGRTRLSIIAFAIAVVAVASALIIGAPIAISGAGTSANPGPAIFGSASVSPLFFNHAPTH
jgi:hypothetical protein